MKEITFESTEIEVIKPKPKRGRRKDKANS